MFFLWIIGVSVLSCTKDKTDYEAEIDVIIPEYDQFEEVTTVRSGEYTVRVNALNGTLFTGYNEIRLQVTGGSGTASDATLLPIYTNPQGAQHTCPHRHALAVAEGGQYFSGYAVFTETGNWVLHLALKAGGTARTAEIPVNVEAQTNQNLHHTAFVGNDGEAYLIALAAPQQPQVGENGLVAAIFNVHTDAEVLHEAYTEADNYTLLLDPRMPEPAMCNHSSPNNKDLTQRPDGFYQGLVNYTMTGNWTLNFILLDETRQVIKGTVVPSDFTPGVAGTKSELHIDILF